MTRALLLAALLLAAPAHATVVPQPGLKDPRIRSVLYDPDEVVRLRGYLGQAVTVEFAPDERIENVSVGDALGWQITPNKRADLLFIKPVDRAPVTGMTVITDRRRYTFELSVAPPDARRDDLAWEVRFTYPAPPAPPPAVVAAMEPPPAPVEINSAYAWDGVRALLPSRVWDDGRATYLQWPAGVTLPTVFVVDATGRERLVDMAARGDSFVVDETAAKLRVREGRQALTLVNQGWRPPDHGPDGPRKLKGNALKDLLAAEHRW